MKIADKAKKTPDIDLARYSGARAYMMLSDELVSADELSPEGEFPQYGDFLEVRTSSGEQYIECPQALAEFLVSIGAETGTGFRIRTVDKVNGEFEYNCEELTPEETDQLSE